MSRPHSCQARSRHQEVCRNTTLPSLKSRVLSTRFVLSSSAQPPGRACSRLAVRAAAWPCAQSPGRTRVRACLEPLRHPCSDTTCCVATSIALPFWSPALIFPILLIVKPIKIALLLQRLLNHGRLNKIVFIIQNELIYNLF